MAKILFETEDPAEARALLGVLEERGSVAPSSTPEPTATSTPAATTEERAEAPADAELDVHGMAWNEEIHASTKAKNADGSWKARKGQAEAAKNAIAAHKAAGGNVTPPADLPEADATPATNGMPAAASGMPAAGGMPTAGARAEEDMPPPVSLAQVEEKIVGMLGRGTLVNQGDAPLNGAQRGTYQELLDRFQIDRADPSGVLTNNETLRAQVMAACLELEPAS